jgi:hypothetical protein
MPAMELDREGNTIATVHISFFDKPVPIGTGKDGLPLYRDAMHLDIDRPPYQHNQRLATEDDQYDYPAEYARYQKQKKVQKITMEDGFPLSMWPLITPAELATLAVREVYTVEQLVKLKDLRSTPPEIAILAERGRQLLLLHQAGGKSEAEITALRGRVEVLEEQAKELRDINTQLNNQLIKLGATPIVTGQGTRM